MSNKTNIIFVDIDGPLLPSKLHLMTQNRKTGVDNPPIFDNFAVTAFNLWAKYGNAKIVFSTNWCYGFPTNQLKDIMRANGLNFKYHDVIFTPKKMTSNRSNEILWWLQDNSTEDMKFIAVDDDYTCEDIQKTLDRDCDISKDIKATGKWIDVNFVDGMTYKNFKDGCEVLGIDFATIDEEEFGIKRLTKEEQKKHDDAIEMLANCIV